MGGTDPARDFVLDALRAGRPVVTANKQLLAQHGDELFAVAREAGVQLRFEAAVAGGDPDRPHDPGELRRDRDLEGVRDRQRHHQLHPQRDGGDRRRLRRGAGAGAGARLRRGRPHATTSAAPTRRRRWRSSPASPSTRPVTLAEVSYEGIEAIQPDDLAYAKELGLSLKLLGVAERRDGGISVRVFPCFLYPGHPLAPIEGPFNAVMVEAPAITEVTMSGPGAGGLQTASAVLGDVVSILAGEAPVHETRAELPIVADVTSSFYLYLEVADRPGVLARVATVLGDHDVSVKSVVQRGAGDDARLVMVVHECLESRFAAAVEALGELDDLRSPPRSIHVIEEEF